jgi:thioredoxin-dependent peroxiredoxin
MAITEGTKAPGFTLQDAAGKRVSLDDFKGNDVVVYFYPKDDTPGCTREACGWGAYGDKMMYGKKAKGIIRSTVWIGPDGAVRKHWKRVSDAAKHPQRVWDAVRGGSA